jgi:hypothetical protein
MIREESQDNKDSGSGFTHTICFVDFMIPFNLFLVARAGLVLLAQVEPSLLISKHIEACK